jgi:hypothetical protein
MSEYRPVYRLASDSRTLIDDVLSSPSSSFWLTTSLRTALSRDPVDAARDAELLAQLLSARVQAVLVEATKSKGQG